VKQGFYDTKPLPEPEDGCQSIQDAVLNQSRGYRLRLSACGTALRAEVFNAGAKRKKSVEVYTSNSPIESLQVTAMTDHAGKPSALVTTLKSTPGQVVLVLNSDKNDVVLRYAAHLPDDASVSVDGTQVVLSKSDAKRKIEWPRKSKETKLVVERSSDEALKSD